MIASIVLTSAVHRGDSSAPLSSMMDEARAGPSRGTIRLTGSAVPLTQFSVSRFESEGSICFSLVVTDLTKHQHHEERLAGQAVSAPHAQRPRRPDNPSPLDDPSVN
jgi:hypothetical protein